MLNDRTQRQGREKFKRANEQRSTRKHHAKDKSVGGHRAEDWAVAANRGKAAS